MKIEYTTPATPTAQPLPKLTGVCYADDKAGYWFDWSNGERITVSTNNTTALFLMTLSYTDFKARLSA
jgi:hypothetical protein